jgi:AcrR family transcriptional regulator
MVGVKGQIQRRGVERRRAIVDAALELFSQRGARGTSVADVAEQVGISPPAVLHHFGTKDDLLLAVIEERDRRGHGAFTELLAQGGMAGIRSLVQVAEANQREPGLLSCFVVLEAENMQKGDIANCYFVTRSQVLRQSLADALAEGQRRGEIRSDIDPAVKATEIMSFMRGAAAQWLLDPEVSLVDLYRSYVSGLERDLAPAS